MSSSPRVSAGSMGRASEKALGNGDIRHTSRLLRKQKLPKANSPVQKLTHRLTYSDFSDEEKEIQEFLHRFAIPAEGVFEYAAVNGVTVVGALRQACLRLSVGKAELGASTEVDEDNVRPRENKIHPESGEGEFGYQSVRQNDEDWDASFTLMVQLAESEGGMEWQFKQLADLGFLDGDENTPRECSVCFEYHPRKEMLQLPCEKHYICPVKECLEASIFHSIKSRTVFSCCKTLLTPENLTAAVVHISEEILADYELLYEELNASTPLFCSLPTCAVFIPSRLYTSAFIAQCGKCATYTCPTCRATIPSCSPGHFERVFRNAPNIPVPTHTAADCKKNQEGEKKKKDEQEEVQFRRVARKENWKMCPKKGCRRWVDKISGCNYVVCNCNQAMCFKCGGKWLTPARNHGSAKCGNKGCVAGAWG